MIDRIKELKKRAGLTNQALAELAGVPIGTLNKLLGSETKEPKLPTIFKIAQALNVSATYLIEGEKEKPASLMADELTEDEKIFVSLPPNLRQEVMKYMRYLVEQEGKQ